MIGRVKTKFAEFVQSPTPQQFSKSICKLPSSFRERLPTDRLRFLGAPESFVFVGEKCHSELNDVTTLVFGKQSLTLTPNGRKRQYETSTRGLARTAFSVEH